MSIANSDSPLQHHYRDMDQQFDAAKLGVWTFLVTEILMFGGLFAGYLIFHGVYPEAFAEGASFLDWRLGAINTVVLLISSFTMALGIFYCQTNQSQKAVKALALTIVFAIIFMVIKYFEYTHKFHLGLYPGKFFAYEGAMTEQLPLYLSFYFCMTALHGSHVLVGIGLIVWVLLRARKGEFNSEYYTPVEGVGLFWHLVDLIWIFLFPLLYLIG